MSSSLSPSEIDQLKAFALTLADAAAKVSLAHFRRLPETENKLDEGFDPVTIADREAERVMRALIEEHYPDHGIDGEEYGIKPTIGALSWCLDPIDGTRAYIAGLPTWGTLIALLEDGVPIMGIIDQPYIGERYVGYPGGAELNGTPITTRALSALKDAVVMTTDEHLFTPDQRSAFMRLRDTARLTRYGFDCYAYGVLAAGHIDIVAETGLQTYDRMALIPVIRGAGGSATDWHGNPAGPSDQLLAVGDPTKLSTILKTLALPNPENH